MSIGTILSGPTSATGTQRTCNKGRENDEHFCTSETCIWRIDDYIRHGYRIEVLQLNGG